MLIGACPGQADKPYDTSNLDASQVFLDETGKLYFTAECGAEYKNAIARSAGGTSQRSSIQTPRLARRLLIPVLPFKPTQGYNFVFLVVLYYERRG